MYRARIIPCLLIQGNGLVKTRKFKDPVYLGDPVNAIRIFSEKEVDEIVVLDIDASREGSEPNYDLIEEMASEAFMPMGYGGGIRTIGQVNRLIRSGIEKVVINSANAESTDLVKAAAERFGSQAIVGGVDVKRTLFGNYRILTKSGSHDPKLELFSHIKNLISAGVGEIFVNNIDLDGMMSGYDTELLRRIAQSANVPVVACGGAGTIAHLAQGIREGGVSAVAAGSMFVFHGKHRGVLISYLSDKDASKICFT